MINKKQRFDPNYISSTGAAEDGRRNQQPQRHFPGAPGPHLEATGHHGVGMIRPTADDAMPLTTPQLLLPINNCNCNLREWLDLCFLKKIANISREKIASNVVVVVVCLARARPEKIMLLNTRNTLYTKRRRGGKGNKQEARDVAAPVLHLIYIFRS